MTILYYNGTTLFTFFAVIGAGNGNSYFYISGTKWNADRLGWMFEDCFSTY